MFFNVFKRGFYSINTEEKRANWLNIIEFTVGELGTWIRERMYMWIDILAYSCKKVIKQLGGSL